MKKIIIIIISGLLLFSANLVLASEQIDTDADGLTDEMELRFNTDPNNPDSDGDGFKDLRELDWAYNPLSSSTVKLPQRVEINLQKQRLYYFVDNVLWREFVVSTGKKSMPTPKGEFKISNKIKKAWSKTYGLWMPHWLGLAGGIGIHELPVWPNGYREGENHLGKAVSHGCIRLGVKEAPYLFERLVVGTKVKIY